MKRIAALLIIFVIVLGGIFLFSPWAKTFFWDDLTSFYNRFFLKLPNIEEQLTGLAEKIEKQIAIPEPLRATEEAPESFLTQAGVIELTNNQREKYGLSPLLENAELDQSAQLKVQDMFNNQYFAHDSPSGVTVGNLADGVGYEFIAIGENLALGNFENDEVLVQAWMDSPGHRANILNSRYQEIGVAVLKGTFEGRTTWLAVQHFGLALAVCPQPDENIKIAIETSQNQINEIFKELQILQEEIKATRPSRSESYQEKVRNYNELAAQYNFLVDQTKVIIDEYNSQVKSFNACLSGTPQ